VKPTAASASNPHADVWTLGSLFFLSRMDWIFSLHYHDSPNAMGSIFVSLAASLVLVVLGYAVARFASERAGALVLRTLVLAMGIFFVWATFRRFLSAGLKLSDMERIAIAVATLAITGLGAVLLANVWQRLRRALIAAALIATFSPFLLVAVLAPRIELFAEPGPHRRPVIVLVLDEFSAGVAHGLATALGDRQLQVGAWSVPSIGKDTLEVIPGLFTGAAMRQVRTCTPSAVCGRGGAVDFRRIRVARSDIDVFGFHHPYCLMSGLRSCVITDRAPEQSTTVLLLCGLPVWWLLDHLNLLDCGQAPSDPTSPDGLANAERAIDGAPFWTHGGILYAHVIVPHPPGLGGELRLVDAYAGNIARTERFVLRLVDRLDRSFLPEEYALVITSDHPLRWKSWCLVPPFSTHGCEVPEAMRTPEVPFIVASRGQPLEHRVPGSNLDLMPIAAEVSATR
jgi:hypothetical protein